MGIGYRKLPVGATTERHRRCTAIQVLAAATCAFTVATTGVGAAVGVPSVVAVSAPYGAIGAHYYALGGARSFLGAPETDEFAATGGRGEDFTGGSIYWTASTGAYEVHGSIRDEWSRLGRVDGSLRFPVTDETGTPDRVGRYNHFQGGSVYWSPTTGPHEVHGAIRDAWARLGWERSQLGYPTSGEYVVAGGRRSDFEHGSLVWNAGSGQVDVWGPGSWTSPPPVGTVLFDPDIAHRGLSAYGQVVNPQDITVMDDPILGAGRRVMKMTVRNSDTGGLTGNPRAQVATPEMFAAGSDVYAGWSSMFPTGFPDGSLPNSGWITLSEFYGPPYSGGSPFSIGETGAAGGISAMTHPPNTSWQTAWQVNPVRHNRWYDFVVHEQLSTGTDGFVEVYVNDGSGWRQTLVNGQLRYGMITMTGANGGGPNYHKLALYYDQSIAGQLTVYHTGQKIGTSFDVVAPHSYG